jgi:type IV secretion system protein VirD4
LTSGDREAPGGIGFWVVHAVLFLLATGVLWALQVGITDWSAGPRELAAVLWSRGWSTELRNAAIVGGLITAVLAASAARRPQRSTLYGDASFGTEAEARRAHLLDETGLILGRWDKGGSLLRNGEHYHVVFAVPPGGGKTSGFVIPNLLSWLGSAVVLDVKYEIHEVTSGLRASWGDAVFRWSPADAQGRSHRYNPLDAIRTDEKQRMGDLQQLASLLIPDQEKENPLWATEARNLFLGLALWVLDTEKHPTIGMIYRRMMDGGAGLKKRIVAMLQVPGDVPGPRCRRLLGHWAQMTDRAQTSVLMGVSTALALWSNPVIDAATSASDFRFEDLRRRPMTIYVGVSPDNLKPLSRLLALFFEQMVGALSRSTPGKDEPVPVLGMLDEFAALGPMPVLAEAMAFLRGYRVRLALIVQGLGQLEKHYGSAGQEAILQNAGLQIFAAANDPSTARYVSERLGKRTVRTESRSQGRGWGTASRSTSSAARDLLLPQEVHELDPDRLIVLREGSRAVLGRKIRYFEEREFWQRCHTTVRDRWGRRTKGAPIAPAPVPELELLEEVAPAPWPQPESKASEGAQDAEPKVSRRPRPKALVREVHTPAADAAEEA